MKKHFFFIFMFLLMTRICAFAYPNMIVEHYTAERGLSNNIVNCTLKGQDGFVWFGTWYGLCSFDGTKFRSYDNHDGFYSADKTGTDTFGSRLSTANSICLIRNMKVSTQCMTM